MVQLNTLQKITKKSMRVGRGIGSSKGKTCGRGGKGQTARSGVSIKGFEGGQTPIYQRLPKRGFTVHRRVETVRVSLDYLIYNIEKGRIGATMDVKDIDNLFLQSKSKTRVKVKILASKNSDISTKIQITGNCNISQTAKKQIEKAGGSVNA